MVHNNSYINIQKLHMYYVLNTLIKSVQFCIHQYICSMLFLTCNLCIAMTCLVTADMDAGAKKVDVFRRYIYWW